MSKWAAYLRVSTDRQSKGLESQANSISAFFKQNNIKEYILFEDENQSGSKASRPKLDDLMAAIRANEIDSVVVYSFSRFARSTRHLLEALDEFEKLGVTFVSLTEKLDTKSPMGRAVFTIISALAQLERELISERVKNGLANAKAKGKRLGAPQKRNTQLINELVVQGLSYRRISALTGISISTICRHLKTCVSKKSSRGL